MADSGHIYLLTGWKVGVGGAEPPTGGKFPFLPPPPSLMLPLFDSCEMIYIHQQAKEITTNYNKRKQFEWSCTGSGLINVGYISVFQMDASVLHKRVPQFLCPCLTKLDYSGTPLRQNLWGPNGSVYVTRILCYQELSTYKINGPEYHLLLSEFLC